MTQNIRQEIINLFNSKEYNELTNFYSKKGIFVNLGISRNEAAHSSFIAWLLNPQSDHGLGLYPIQRFLSMIGVQQYNEKNEKRVTNKIDDFYLIENYEIKEVQIATEVSTNLKIKQGIRRLDILIHITIEKGDGKTKTLPIIIENKVGSKEQNQQTIVYFEWGKKEYKGRKYEKPVYIFLSPTTLPCASKDFLLLNYQQLLDYVISPAQKRCKNQEASLLIDSYIRCLSVYDLMGINDEDTKENRRIVMARTKEEVTLLKELFRKNKGLFIAVMEMMSDDEETDPEDKERLKNALSTISNRDYSSYKFDGDVYNKRRLVLAIVKKYVEKNKGITLDRINELFPAELYKTNSHRKLIVNKNDLKQYEMERYFTAPDETIHLGDGTEAVVWAQWGIDNIKNMINRAEELGLPPIE